MKRIIFLQDYKGSETNQVAYKAGQVAMFPAPFAERLISDHVAELYKEQKQPKKETS